MSLERHERRRAEGQAALSVLDAPAPFLAWAQQRGLLVARASPRTVHRAALEHVLRDARASPLPDRELFVERLTRLDPRSRQPLSVVLGLISEAPLESPWIPLMSLEPLPAVLVDARAAPLSNDELTAIAASCLECPALPVGLVLDRPNLAELLRGPPSRARALLEEGVMFELPERPTAAPLEARLARSLERLHRDAAGPEVVEALRAAATALPEQARSLAEALLLRLLEACPETRGRFHLNVLQPWSFGPRPAELDLFSPVWRIAIEVDGYHHFQDDEAYRRDRRKDVELQLHGIFVTRVLAKDLVDDVGATFDALLDALRRRVRTRG